MNLLNDEYWMRMALKEANYAREEDEVPIGAVIVCNGKIIAKGYNQTERLNDVTAHAEMIAITAGANYLGAKFLEECTIYVTVEPCPMCAAALRWARISKVVYGASDPKSGYTQFGPKLFHPKTEIQHGTMEHECGVLMKEFFKGKREK
jgi:tRNA(adenine34) deaminase